MARVCFDWTPRLARANSREGTESVSPGKRVGSRRAALEADSRHCSVNMELEGWLCAHPPGARRARARGANLPTFSICKNKKGRGEESIVETTGKRLAGWQSQLYTRNALRQAPGQPQKALLLSYIREMGGGRREHLLAVESGSPAAAAEARAV
jgi:hypothetical protein